MIVLFTSVEMASNMAALVALVALLLLQLSVAALEDLCHPNPCGLNTLCEIDNDGPFCKCQPGYLWSESAGCRHECENNGECGPQMACIEFKCQNPCSQCGLNANCEDVQNHVPVCKCPRGYFGNPLFSCYPECTQHGDCPPEKPTCFNNSCTNPCEGMCGIAANCELRNGIAPVCSCPKNMAGDPLVMCRPVTNNDLCEPNIQPRYAGYTGDPLYNCTRAECRHNSECGSHLVCQNERCVDPCQNVCRENANCETRNHAPICTCPPGYTGDPFTNCRRFGPDGLCHPSPCGVNTLCEVVNNVPTCKCEPGYYGSPIAGCRHECENNAECGTQMACIEFRCQNPCSQCGLNADCKVVQNHVPVCKCPRGYFGNPLSSCQPECTQHTDCPPGKPECFYNSCKNPCDGACGISANCDLRNGITPVCSCPKDMTGDPFVMCRPFTKEDLCKPNPCGPNAKCEPGYDRYNKERPVCTCHAGYIGDPIKGCTRRVCDGVCGIAANCDLRNGITPVCSCPKDMTGDPFVMCRPFTKEELCKPNPCGANAKCEPGYDRYKKERPVCTCHAGYIGDPIKGCTRRI